MIDLNAFAQDSNTSITISKNKTENEHDGNLRRFKEKSLFIVTLAIISIVIIFCGAIVLFYAKDNNNLSTIALNGIIGISLGVAGYTLRGKSKD